MNLMLFFSHESDLARQPHKDIEKVYNFAAPYCTAPQMWPTAAASASGNIYFVIFILLAPINNE